MIAHQWRQPLNNLSLISQTLAIKYKKGKLDDKVMLYFEKSSKKQINYMSDTIDEFKDFFKPELEKRIFNIYQSVENTLSILSPILAKNGIKIIHDDCNNCNSKDNCKGCLTEGYPNKLGQSLINIINNAKDALVENNIDDAFINIYYDSDEKYIKLYIEDNAGGIPEDIIERIFDPYFSTKSDKNGTGIGLYMSKIIIEEHMDGKITVCSIDGVTTFEIILNRSMI
jgi:signal transduction histidine kinase